MLACQSQNEAVLPHIWRSECCRATNALPEIAVKADGRFQCTMLMNFYHHMCVRSMKPVRSVQSLLQHIAAEIVGVEKPRPHFPGPELRDTALSLIFQHLYAGLTASASQLEQQELLLEALAHLLLSHAEDRVEPQRLGWEHPAIRRVKAYLAEHYAEDVSLEVLANVANLSAFHLTRVFRQANGLPPHAYQIQLRMSQARRLLAQGFSVSYVANETGFFDQTHFTNQFKRHVGVTPGTYRKTARFY